MSFKLGTFALPDGKPFAGVVIGDRVSRLEGGITVLGLLQEWDRNFAELGDRAGSSTDSIGISDLVVLPPIYPAGAALCAGSNYRRHVIEMRTDAATRAGVPRQEAIAAATEAVDERARSGLPFVFVSWPGAVIGAYDAIGLPADTGAQHDWELELAVVIGRHACRVLRDRALEYVAGYTIVNDVSTRDCMSRSDVPFTDFFATKSRATFKPTGPYITPAAFVDNPHDLRMTLRVNGETMQDASTGDMLFRIERLIEYCSFMTCLRPGDIILTGSPAGNAAHHGGRYLVPGDVIEGEIESLGMQRNECRLSPTTPREVAGGDVFHAI